MDEPEYAKCSCKECGNNIEFPRSAAGTTITCPHCQQWTELPGSEKKPRLNGGWILALVGIALLAALANGWWYYNKGPTPSIAIPVNPPPAQMNIVAPTNLPPPIPAPPPEEPKIKSLANLKVSPVTLEQTKGSRLVHAVGTVTNASPWQRFSVKVELELSDAQGKSLGTAKDYKAILEPHQEWTFHALVTAPKTAHVKILSLTESE